MVDRLTKDRRSWNMSRVRGRDTKPELVVRSLLHRQGFRFRLHSKKLPGKPDIVLPRHRTIIFVHGCFWHRHLNCSDATVPKTHTSFWVKKFEENVRRDIINQEKLRNLGWKVLVIWECEIGNPEKLVSHLIRGIKAPSV